MIPLGLSELEFRQLIESGLLPMRCQCEIDADRMSIHLSDPKTGKPALSRTDIALVGLNNSRAISDLIALMRLEVGRQQNAALPRARFG